MIELNWEKNREKRKADALKRHSNLHKLFVDDKLAFESEKKRLIEEFFNNIKDDKMRDRLRKLQDSWDNKMLNAESEHDRFVLAQKLLLDHFYERWRPAMKQFAFAGKTAITPRNSR